MKRIEGNFAVCGTERERKKFMHARYRMRNRNSNEIAGDVIIVIIGKFVNEPSTAELCRCVVFQLTLSYIHLMKLAWS